MNRKIALDDTVMGQTCKPFLIKTTRLFHKIKIRKIGKIRNLHFVRLCWLLAAPSAFSSELDVNCSNIRSFFIRDLLDIFCTKVEFEYQFFE